MLASGYGHFSQHRNLPTHRELERGLGRRESSTLGNTLIFKYDGSSMIGWANTFSLASYNFMAIPGAGAVEGWFTSGGNTTTWVPLIDASGSTIALVNAASTQSPPATTYTYDPSGNPTLSGTPNSWPFLFKGLEKEFTDPGPFYYSGAGQFYSPQLVRSLSQVGQTSSSGPGGGGFSPAGMAISRPSGSGGGLSPQSVGNDSQQALQVGTDIYQSFNALKPFLGKEASDALAAYVLPLAIIGGAVDFLVNFFEDIFGGGDNPPLPRQLHHGRHPLYPVILGIQNGLIPNEASAVRFKHLGMRPLSSEAFDDLPPHLPGLVDVVGSKGTVVIAADVLTEAALTGLGVPMDYASFLAASVGFAVGEAYSPTPPSPQFTSLGRVLFPGTLFGTPTLADYKRARPLLGF